MEQLAMMTSHEHQVFLETIDQESAILDFVTDRRNLKEGKKMSFIASLGVAGVILNLRRVMKQVENEKSLERKIGLLAKQNALLGFLQGLTLFIDTKERSLLKSIKALKIRSV